MTHARKVELSASEDRLEQLIAELLRPGADSAFRLVRTGAAG